jgi:hypothetical protein
MREFSHSLQVFYVIMFSVCVFYGFYYDMIWRQRAALVLIFYLYVVETCILYTHCCHILPIVQISHSSVRQTFVIHSEVIGSIFTGDVESIKYIREQMKA